jgi:hypothetical protein
MGAAAHAVMTRRYLSDRYSNLLRLPYEPVVYWTRRTVRASDQCFSSE